MAAPQLADTDPPRVSDELEEWLTGEEPKTLGGLIDVFGERSFAIVFVLLLAVPALPLPTGGVTHVFEVIAMLLSLELIVGRRTIWLPARWRGLQLGGESKEKFINLLLRRIRTLERISRPRGRWLFGHRLSGSVFGLTVLGLTLAAFFAPPFSGLDTLPSIGVVVLALGYLLTDVALAAAGALIGLLGVASVIFLGSIAVKFFKGLF
ncbi:MAG TPA: exopolysaccharide biosynthesis protein [Solirubrobacteraceae bacterium]|nr:exopolysaccharide biosynthesis protein [Solirubrobacteraceae bacterium]